MAGLRREPGPGPAAIADRMAAQLAASDGPADAGLATGSDDWPTGGLAYFAGFAKFVADAGLAKFAGLAVATGRTALAVAVLASRDGRADGRQLHHLRRGQPVEQRPPDLLHVTRARRHRAPRNQCRSVGRPGRAGRSGSPAAPPSRAPPAGQPRGKVCSCWRSRPRRAGSSAANGPAASESLTSIS